MSKGLDPDQDRRFVGPDLGSKCLQRLSADNKSHLARKEFKLSGVLCITCQGNVKVCNIPWALSVHDLGSLLIKY